ncbi:MAG: copper(I)-binding protein [Gammaproteobacteria bacterium]|jgi:copper(I)-binding protein
MNKVNLFLLTIFIFQTFFSSSAFTNESVEVRFSDAWISEAPPTVSVLAGYANIYNASDKPIALIKVSSPNFSKIEIHRSVLNGDMVSMEKQESLEIPAKNTIKLSPGDLHLMLFDPDKPLRSGDTATLNFSFSDGHNQSIEAQVERRSSNDHSSEDHSHHHH